MTEMVKFIPASKDLPSLIVTARHPLFQDVILVLVTLVILLDAEASSLHLVNGILFAKRSP